MVIYVQATSIKYPRKKAKNREFVLKKPAFPPPFRSAGVEHYPSRLEVQYVEELLRRGDR